jgi:hypothetical protein
MEDEEARSKCLVLLDRLKVWMVGPGNLNHAPEQQPELQNLLLPRLHEHREPLLDSAKQIPGHFAFAARVLVPFPLALRLLLDGVMNAQSLPHGVQLIQLAPAQTSGKNQHSIRLLWTPLGDIDPSLEQPQRQGRRDR